MDFEHAIEIKTNIYWVGKHLKDDLFQSHPYLIVNGDESVLIDGGSMLVFNRVVEKIEELIALKQIKYIVVSHQDPDLAASLPELEKKIARKDLKIITHSRMTTLIKHYDCRSDFYEIDKHGLKLSTKNGLVLQFLTTPYCHSPGAFVTYMPSSKVLFSSDIFSGLEKTWSFYADETYFDETKLFHETYMPSRDILNYSLNKIEQLDIELIAPQHGSLVKRPYIKKLIEDIKELECGLYIDQGYSKELTAVVAELKREIEKNKEQDRLLHTQVKNAQMGEMINMIAHQWRQPLNAISIAAMGVSMNDELGVQSSENLNTQMKFIQEQAQQMSKTINDFMDFFKPESETKDFMFSEVINSILSLMSAQLESKNIQFIFDAATDILIHGHKKELDHVLINLIVNARDEYENKDIKNKFIEVSCTKREGVITLNVRDQAGGIPSAIIDKIFNPYFTTKEQGKGTGIGLYMTKRIVTEVLKGSIQATNEKKGALFTILLNS